MTSKWQLRLNFIAALGLLGTAIGLLLIFGYTQAAWYIVVEKQPGIGLAFWFGSFDVAAICIWYLYRISKKLKAKMALVVG